MVFFYTSSNIKTLRNILMSYEDEEGIVPYEFIKKYIELCPADVEDQKLSWIAETFLGLQKHMDFLRVITKHVCNKKHTEEELYYFMVVLYGVTFQLDPKHMNLLYKSLFNLSKPMLNTFTSFLSNNEMLTFISEVAQAYYDAHYIAEKIIAPLFMWQPYISEMAHDYAEYMSKVASRKVKPLTVPATPNVLNRKGKEPTKISSQPSVVVSPVKSVSKKNRKLLSKSALDKKLQEKHEKNKKTAENLLNFVKNNDPHYAKPKSNGNPKINYDEPSVTDLPKPRKIVSKSTIPVRENIATIKRMSQRVQMTEQEEVEWIQNLMSCCRNSQRLNELLESERQEKEKERLFDIERKHLMGQISHEEAILAKIKVEEQNKLRYEEFLKEKEKWERSIMEWKKRELEKCRSYFEKASLCELNIIGARNAIAEKNKEIADKIKKETANSLAEIMKNKQEELDNKIKMIKEINVLGMIAKKSKALKIVDLTESSGVGLLCEMSIAELQERLTLMKIGIKEELQQRNAKIKEGHEAAKKYLEDTKNTIKSFVEERAEMRKQRKLHTNNKKTAIEMLSTKTKEINDLKKTLEEKRKLRMKLGAV